MDELVKHMVDRFLGWQLPEDFNPDAGISFKAEYGENGPYPGRHKPIGTNLFDARQAEVMVRYMLEGLHFPPAVPASKTQHRRLVAQGAIEPSVPVSKLEALRDDLKIAVTEAHNEDQRVSLEVVIDDLEALIAEAK